MTLIPDHWVSIDPGDRHVGFASWHGETCVTTREVTPTECMELLVMLTGLKTGRKVIDLVVCESFALYGDHAHLMVGNEFLTSQLIGAIKFVCHMTDTPYVAQSAKVGKATYYLDWYKKLTPREKRAMPWWGQLKNGDHCKDAWAHGMTFVRKRNQSQSPPPKRSRAPRRKGGV